MEKNWKEKFDKFFSEGHSLSSGKHSKEEEKFCALEAYTIITKQDFSDHPPDVSSAASGFVRSFQDSLPNDAERDRLIAPILYLLKDTRGSDRLELRRTFLALDWDIRVRTPAFLRLAGLNEQADNLSNLSEITNLSELNKVEKTCSAADSAAYSAARSAARSAAHSAAYSAAYSAARSAARSAAYSAAYSAARSAARSAAYSAARSAAYSAAYSAARSAADSAARSAAYSAAYSAARSAAQKVFASTVSELQESAINLIKKMCNLKEEDIPSDWNWS